MTILVSACLLGCPCRYDGAAKADSRVLALMERHALIPVCPEQLGGLPTPRLPSERREGGVFDRGGKNVTPQYRQGAEEVLRLARLYGCTHAVLKERSPSCGRGAVYDGIFSGAVVPGDGVTAAMLAAEGVEIWGESQIEELLPSEDRI